MTPEISTYISKRYPYWLDYAQYQSTMASFPEQAGDILNTVLLSILEKPEEKIIDLLEKKSGQYTELDFYILKMIKLNSHSPTSPYRFKTKDLPQNNNISPWDLEILDEEYDHVPSSSERVLSGMRLLRTAIDWTFLQSTERSVVGMKIFHGVPVTKSAKLLKVSYASGRECFHSGIKKVKEISAPPINTTT